jgi:hypothetical protein
MFIINNQLWCSSALAWLEEALVRTQQFSIFFVFGKTAMHGDSYLNFRNNGRCRTKTAGAVFFWVGFIIIIIIIII